MFQSLPTGIGVCLELFRELRAAINQHVMLVGGLNPSETYEFVNWDDYSQYNGKNKSHVPVTTNQLCCLMLSFFLGFSSSWPCG